MSRKRGIVNEAFGDSEWACACMGRRRRKSGARALSTQADVFDNFDLLCHVLACIDDPDVEVMGRAAARWCALNHLHRRMIDEEPPWRLLVARASARTLLGDDALWAKRVCNSPTIDTFFELCSLARLQRQGVPRHMVRTAFKVFLNTDGKARWRVICDEHAREGAVGFDANRKFTFIVDAWERMDPLERNVFYARANRMFRVLGFGGYRTLPGVRKYDDPSHAPPPC